MFKKLIIASLISMAFALAGLTNTLHALEQATSNKQQATSNKQQAVIYLLK